MKNKIIAIMSILIIIVGMFMIYKDGLNFGLNYSKHKEIEIYIEQEFENTDIYKIAIEVFGIQEMSVRKVELYEDMVQVSVRDVTDEQLQVLNTKINEKYSINNTIEDIIVNDIPNTRGRDLIKPYILPISISLGIIIIYLIIYNVIYSHIGREVKIVKTIIKAITKIVTVQLVYISILSITRLPVTHLTIPIAIALYILTTIRIMVKLEKENSKIKE